jgi:hypothetical protein
VILKDVLLDDDDAQSNKGSKILHLGHHHAVTFHCLSEVIHASFYTLLKQFFVNY